MIHKNPFYPNGEMQERTRLLRWRNIESRDRCERGGLRFLQPLRDRFRVAHHAQQIAASELGEIAVAPTPTCEFLKQCGILVDAVQTQGSNWDSVEVGAESDAIHTRHLAYVLDMIGDHRNGHDRRRVGSFPLG